MPILTASADYENLHMKPRRYRATFVCNWEMGKAHYFRSPKTTYASYDEALNASRRLEADFVKHMQAWLDGVGYEEYDFHASYSASADSNVTPIKTKPAEVKKAFMALSAKERAAILKTARK